MVSYKAQVEALEYRSLLSPCVLSLNWCKRRVPGASWPGSSLGSVPSGRMWKEEQDPEFQPGSSTDIPHAFGQVAPILGFSFLYKIRGTGFDGTKVHPALSLEFHGFDSGRCLRLLEVTGKE